jgi:hypothetical protein
MYSTKMRLGGLLAVLMVLVPLWAAAQTRAREARRESSASRGPIHVTNDGRESVSLSMRSENQDRMGEWRIRSGEEVVLQRDGEQVRVRPHHKIKVGDRSGWVDVSQVGEFRNGTWYVNVRDVQQAMYRDNPRDDTSRPSEEPPRREEPRREESTAEHILRKFNIP